MIVQAASIFGAGLLTSLTPCIYPMIPITLGYLGNQTGTERKKLKVLAFVLGQVVAFTALGVITVYVGEVFGFSSEIPQVQIAAALILFVFAYFSWKGELPKFLTKLSPSLSPKTSSSKKQFGLFGAFTIGATSAVVASPCASPILGGVLTSIASAESLFTGGVLMLFYSLGITIIFLVLGLGIVSTNKIPKSGPWLAYVHKLSSLMLAIAGGYFLYQAL